MAFVKATQFAQTVHEVAWKDAAAFVADKIGGPHPELPWLRAKRVAKMEAIDRPLFISLERFARITIEYEGAPP